MNKRSRCFAVTINHVDWSKTTLGEWLMIDDYCSRLAIGDEKYHPPLDCETGEIVPGDHGKHQHVFMETQEKWLLVEVREHLVLFTDGEYSIDIQTCRSAKSWLIYLSKEDIHPFLHNVRVSELSLFARAWHHAKTTYRTPRPVNRQDEFIVSCGQNARFAIRICEEHVQNLRQQQAYDRPLYAPNVMCDVVNDVLVALESPNHVYIYGEPGLGKTELVDWFLRSKKYWKAGEPSNFVFGTLSDQVDYIWFEDFKLDKYLPYLSTLLSMMDKKEVTISRKGIDDCTKMIFAKFIYCSNYEIDDLYPMFKRRIHQVDVPHKLFECNGCGRRRVITNYISDNQLGSFDITSQQLMIDLQQHTRETREDANELLDSQSFLSSDSIDF